MEQFKFAEVKKFCNYENLNIINGCYSCGYFYFLNLNSNLVTIYDNDLQYIDSMETCRVFTKITYDIKDKCFWAYATKKFNKLYKLNSEMEEIGCLDIDDSLLQGCKISSLNYNLVSDTLVISINGVILNLDKCGNCISKLVCKREDFNFPYVFGKYIFNLSCKNIEAFEKCEFLTCCELPNNLNFIAIIQVFYLDERTIKLCLLAVDCDNTYYLFCMTFSILACKERECDCDKECKCDCISDCICNGNSVNDILESIALIETSLSHILNAEGEKIQKAVCLATCVNELLDVNYSVEKTISAVTVLETQLYSKLRAVQEICEKCKGHNCNPCDKKECGCDKKECRCDKKECGYCKRDKCNR